MLAIGEETVDESHLFALYFAINAAEIYYSIESANIDQGKSSVLLYQQGLFAVMEHLNLQASVMDRKYPL